jgi:transposase
MRSIALDVHRDFCEVAIKDGGEVRSAGRIKTGAEELELFAQSLAGDDRVALEASGPALQIKRLLEPHVGRVVIANTRKLRAIAESKVKTDKVDARTLCELLAAGYLPEVFGPDEAPGRCGGGWPAAPRWFASAPAQRTSSTRCSPATSRDARR